MSVRTSRRESDEPGSFGSRRRAEIALRESEQRFRLAFDEAPIGMAIVGLHGPDPGRFQRVNAAMCRITGYTDGELIGTSFRVVNQSEHHDESAEMLERMAAGAIDHWEAEKHFRHACGDERWVHIHASVARGADGQAAYCIFQVLDITDRKRAEARLTHNALHDPLTGLPNRTLLVENLKRAIDRAARAQRQVALLFIDLDDFKTVNDTLGHDVGDELLIEVTRRLTCAMRGADTVARFGGDEFIVVCEELAEDDETTAIVDRVRRSLHAPLTLRGTKISVRASIGVARSSASPTPEALLRDSDIAMYRAKGRVGAEERRRLEVLHAHTLADMEQAQRLAGVGSWTWEPATDAMSWSPQMFEIYGRDPRRGAASQRDGLAYVHAEDRERVALDIAASCASAAGFEYEYRIIGDDGAQRLVRLIGHLDRDEPDRYIGTLQDVTEQRRIQQATAHLAAIVQSSDDAIIGTTLTGTLTSWNPAAERMYGYTAAEAIGRHMSLLAPSRQQRGEIAMILGRLAAGERIDHFETTRRHKDGRDLDVALTISPIRNSDGAVVGAASVARDIADQKRFEDRLRDLSDHDALTGLLNRHSLTRELEAHAASTPTGEAQGALLLIDLDHFKFVNDTLGHRAGDEIIRHVGRLLERCLAPEDLLARLDGDQFAVLLPSADETAARTLAGRMLSALDDPSNETLLPNAGRITASAGIETFKAGLNGEAVLVNAELAMYDAKNAGRNRTAVYHSDETNQNLMEGQIRGVRQIRTALRQDRFTLFAQPIIDYHTGCACSRELLIRVRDEDGVLKAPGSLLTIAERLDLIQEIDAWVVRSAVRLLAETAGETALPLHVNVSGRSVGDSMLLALIESELARTGVDPSMLVIEITETAAVRQIAEAQQFGERLRALGCRLALDDFGTGFGTLYYLKHLPFECLKIDGEFVRNCRHDTSDRVVIEAIVAIARGLGKRTIAECVEDEETAQLLIELGVDCGQGNYHGHPAATARQQLRAAR